MALTTHLRPHRPRQRGGAIVEFALILTLMISMLAGIVEFGRTFWYYDALSKATRNAARRLAVNVKGDIFSKGVSAATALVVADAQAAGLPDFSSTNVKVTCWTISSNTLVLSTCTDGIAPAAVKVEIISYHILAGKLIPFLIGGASNYDLTLAPATTMPYMPAS
jgi:hypothetical protein